MADCSSLFADGQFSGVRIDAVKIRDGKAITAAEWEASINALSTMCEPAGPSRVAEHIAVLRARTVARQGSDADQSFRATVLAKDLGGYPLDVVAYAVDYWCGGGRENCFFPTWPELKEICERRMRGRVMLLDAVTAAACAALAGS